MKKKHPENMARKIEKFKNVIAQYLSHFILCGHGAHNLYFYEYMPCSPKSGQKLFNSLKLIKE